MDQVRKFLGKVYLGVATERSAKLKKLVDAGQWGLLQEETLGNPNDYKDAMSYFKDAIVVELTRKLLLPGDNQKRLDAAKKLFWDSEAQCASTNARLNRFVSFQGPFEPQDAAVIPFIMAWRKEIKRVLGRVTYVLEPAFSKGSTLSDQGRFTTIPDKMSSTPTAYRPFELFLAFSRTPMERPVTYVRGNRFFTVPKDSQKDRGCCVEASWNLSMQLAVGKILKSKYRKAYGVDLSHGKPIHMKLAQQASVDGLMATIDLSNASDTVATSLIKMLLPKDWFILLNSLRASSTQIDEKQVYLQKFSSMGNGFTFELETIVYRSMLAALGINQAWCYGDDMIVPTNRAADVKAALKFAGFTVNAKKTFCEGPFRESCGGDFFDGVPVRAHYMKELPDEPQKWVSLANGLRRVDPKLLWLRAAWRFCIDQLPSEWRNYGPASLGDLVLHVEDPEPRPHTFVRREWFYDPCLGVAPKLITIKNVLPAYRVMRPVTRGFRLERHRNAYEVAIASACLGVGEFVTPRDRVTGYKPDYVVAWGLPDDPGWWIEPDSTPVKAAVESL